MVVCCFDICLPLSLISFADRHFPRARRRCLIDFFFFLLKTNYYLVVRKLSLWPARVRDTVPDIPMQTAKSPSTLSDLLYSALYTLLTSWHNDRNTFLLNLQLSRMHSLPRQGMPCEEMLNDVVIYRGLLQELRRLPDRGPELGTRCLKRGGEVVKIVASFKILQQKKQHVSKRKVCRTTYG